MIGCLVSTLQKSTSIATQRATQEGRFSAPRSFFAGALKTIPQQEDIMRFSHDSIIESFMQHTRQAAGWRDPAIKGGWAQPSMHDFLTLLSDEDAAAEVNSDLEELLDGAAEDGVGIRVGEAVELEPQEEVLDDRAMAKLLAAAKAHFSEEREGVLADLAAKPTMTDAWRDEVGPWTHEFTAKVVDEVTGEVTYEDVTLGYQGGESVDDASLLPDTAELAYRGWLAGQEEMNALERDCDWQLRQEMLATIRAERAERFDWAAGLLAIADDSDAKALIEVIRDTIAESRGRCGNGVKDRKTGEVLFKGAWWHVWMTKEQLEQLEAMVPAAKAEADAKKAASAARWAAKQARAKRFADCLAWLSKPQSEESLAKAWASFKARYWGAQDGSTVGSITRCFKTGEWGDCYLDTKQGAAIRQAFASKGFSKR